MTATGGCLCGAVTYRAEGLETHYHACHCDTCRRWSGGPAFGIRVGSVQFDGEAHIKAYKSSDWAERGFCTACGANLFYRIPEAGMTILWAGTLDDQSALQLDGEIYIDKKPPGYNFAGDHSRQTEAEFMAAMGAPAE